MSPESAARQPLACLAESGVNGFSDGLPACLGAADLAGWLHLSDHKVEDASSTCCVFFEGASLGPCVTPDEGLFTALGGDCSRHCLSS